MTLELTMQACGLLTVDTVRHVDGVLRARPVDGLYNKIGDSAVVFRVR
jgi:hypothetical protein